MSGRVYVEIGWGEVPLKLASIYPGSKVIKLFFILNSVEHEIFPANQY